MSCFGCCGEDDMHKAADNGGAYQVKNSSGIPVVSSCVLYISSAMTSVFNVAKASDSYRVWFYRMPN